MTLEDAKTLSEIVSNYASPIANIVAAIIAVLGAKQVTERVIHARGSIGTAQSQPPTGSATGETAPTPATSSPPQGSARSIPDKQ
jgi:hypothetical protein